MKNSDFMVLHSASSTAIFSPEGELLDWIVEGKSVVLNRPIRQNTRTDWQGIQIWIKSLGEDPGEQTLLPLVEYARTVEKTSIEDSRLIVRQRGDGWILDLVWTLHENVLQLSTSAQATGKHIQIELLCWAPLESPRRGLLEGRRGNKDWNYEIPRFGKVFECALDLGSALRFRSASGYQCTLETEQPYTLTHVYHRGLSLKLGSASNIAPAGGRALLDARFSIEKTGLYHVTTRPVSEPDRSLFRGHHRNYAAGLMLHLQYTQESNIVSRLEKWIQLTRALGFDFILLELNRALRVHPYAPDEALRLETFAHLAETARREGIPLIPCYNLLGHQFETGLLEWKPDWRETEFDGLCVSHPEVKFFARDLLRQLVEAFQAPWVHIGGDELKLPYDVKHLECARCGVSPNLNAIVEYWNFLQASMPAGKHITIWGDQLLPADKIAAGLTAHNWDGKAESHLQNLDRRIHIINWQYSAVDPASSQHFLKQEGHSVSLASGQYALENAFIHAEACRKGDASFSVHTTWASPHPADCPLESVAAAALAHAGEKFDPQSTAVRCRDDAEWMFDFLQDAGDNRMSELSIWK